MIRFLRNLLPRKRTPAKAARGRARAFPSPDEGYRNEIGFFHPALGSLHDDWNIEAWCGRLQVGEEDCDLTLLERAEDGYPQADPRRSGLARLIEAATLLETELLRPAIAAVIAARTERLDWRDGPPEDCWSPIEILVDRDDRLWMSLYESTTDEYSLWIVAFDVENRPREVRRTPFTSTRTALICDRGEIV